VLSGLPPIELLSIEHDLDYYDVQEGMFNSFSTEDYNKLNSNAKEYIRKKAMESDLLKTAAEQKNLWLETIRFIAESAGWTLEVQGQEEPEMPERFGN
jgi:hypothetical protein